MRLRSPLSSFFDWRIGLPTSCVSVRASASCLATTRSRNARIAATHNQSKHNEYFVTPNDILALIQAAVPAYDEPFGNSSIIPTYYCARLAADNGVSHLLAGDGGDELFGGNARYADDRVFQHYASAPGRVRRLLIEPTVAAGNCWTGLRFFDLAARYIRRSKIDVPDRLFSYSLLSSEPNERLFTADFLAALAHMPPASGVALGFDRLVMLAVGARRIDDVIWTPLALP